VPNDVSLADRRTAILDRIARAAKDAGRITPDITLVAVSKQQPQEKIAAMLDAGQRVFGENRVQEAATRWSGENRREGVELRLIGPLQSNKAAEAVALFDVIETVDREKIAGALAEAMAKAGRTVRLYVQVNTGEEPQKAGVSPAQADGLIAVCRERYGLFVEGLMCIPPENEPAGLHFALLRKIARRNGVEKLSMGMSGDFETAVRFGATSVRVGTALFGGR
jgi:pyridoxal phosphate enzyme (YggS family)